ncbi:hypothetical protein OROHE_003071 [Orobanche hederae]
MQKYIEVLEAQLPTDLRGDFCFINVDGCQMIKEHDIIKAQHDNLQIDNEYSGLEYMLPKLVTEELWKKFGSCKVVLWPLHHLPSNEYTLLVIRKRDKRFIHYTSFKNGNQQGKWADYVINWMDEFYVGSAFEALATQNSKEWRERITGHDDLGRVNLEYACMSTAKKTTRNYIISKKLNRDACKFEKKRKCPANKRVHGGQWLFCFVLHGMHYIQDEYEHSWGQCV